MATIAINGCCAGWDGAAAADGVVASGSISGNDIVLTTSLGGTVTIPGAVSTYINKGTGVPVYVVGTSGAAEFRSIKRKNDCASMTITQDGNNNIVFDDAAQDLSSVTYTTISAFWTTATVLSSIDIDGATYTYTYTATWTTWLKIEVSSPCNDFEYNYLKQTIAWEEYVGLVNSIRS